MVIQETFKTKDEIAEIREIIENISVTGCVSSYHDYINNTTAEGFEKKFINELYSKRYDFAENILELYLNTLSKEELINRIITENIEDPSYCYSYRMDNNDEDEFFLSMFTEKEMCLKIKKHMSSVLEEIVKENELTKKEKEIATIKKDIETTTIKIERQKAILSEYGQKLIKLQQSNQ